LGGKKEKLKFGRSQATGGCAGWMD